MATKEAINKLIAERMGWLRTELFQMTQADFAEAIGVSHQHIISEYENGHIKPGHVRCMILIKLAKKHGKDIDMKWLRPDLED